ncbi:MAG: putative sulfate transporter [Chlamydiae bacterium]|nr:putative sulfate transporter [Chlamydiota bacterium]
MGNVGGMAFGTLDPAPFWGGLKRYSRKNIRGDLTAAVSIALMALPQAMAYAFLADLPLSAGIWSVIFGTIFTAAFGTSRFLVSGTTNMVAILIQSGTSDVLYTYYRGVSGLEREALAMQLVLQIVLLIGIFQILAGLFRLGRLTQFTSRSVIVGYMTGAAFVIAVTQLFPFFGIRDMEGYHPIYQQGVYILGHLGQVHLPTFLLAVGSLLLLIIFHRLSPKIPAAAVVFLLAAGFVALFGLSPKGQKGLLDLVEGEKVERIAVLEDLGPIRVEKPKISPPFFEVRVVTKLVPIAFALALLSVLEVTAIGRSYTKAKEPPYNDNQEIYGLGISNFLSSFVGAMPSSGSFSRTALNFATGAKTQFSAILSGGVVYLLIATVGFLVGRIPIAALSALMLFTAYTMVQFRSLWICLKATRADAFVVWITFLSTLFFTMDVAFYIGVAVSIVLYLKQAGVPLLVEYAFNSLGKLRPLEVEEDRPDPAICIVQAEGELFFGAADLLQTKLRHLAEEEGAQVLILQLLNTRSLDASVCLALSHIYSYLKGTKRHFFLTGISPEVWGVLEDAGLLDLLGRDRCYPANEQLPSEPTRHAYALSKTVLTSHQ